MVSKEIIILGMGASRHVCPYDKEVWGVNTGYRQIGELICPSCRNQVRSKEEQLNFHRKWPKGGPQLYFDQDKGELKCPECDFTRPQGRVDKLIMAHNQAWDSEGDAIFNWDELNYLADKGVEIWNTKREKKLKARYLNWRRLSKKLGCDYFSDAICYMIAHAIDKNTIKVDGVVKLTTKLKLYIYGVDMLTQDEYSTEKGGIEYWIGYLRGLGGEVWIHPESTLLKSPTGKPYGEKYFKWQDLDPKRAFRRKRVRKPPETGIMQNALDRIITPNDKK